VVKVQEQTILEQNKQLENIPLEYSLVNEKDNELKGSQYLVKTKEDSIRTDYTHILDESTDYQGSLLQDSRLTQSFTMDLADISSTTIKNKWKTQKKSLLADIQQKNSIIQQLKYDTIDSKLHQRELEKLRHENDRRLKQKVVNLEQELSNLNKSYDEIGANIKDKRQKSQKVRNFNERVKRLESLMSAQIDNLEKLSTIEEEDSYAHMKRHARLKRSIKGGQSGDSRFSSVFGCN